MNQSKLFILVLLLLLFIVSCSKILLIPVTLIISGFFVVKKKYNIALIVLSVLFFISLIFDNKIETFNTEQSKEMVAVVPTENTDRVESPKSTQAKQPKSTQANSEDNKQIEKPSTEKRHYHRLSIKEFSKLFFVLNSLLDQKYLEKHKMSIEEIIDNYRIKSIYDLSRTVLNREQNPRFNNFLEKITCRGKNGSVNYIECDNENYKRVYAFCELLYVYTLDLDKIIELINVNKIITDKRLENIVIYNIRDGSLTSVISAEKGFYNEQWTLRNVEIHDTALNKLSNKESYFLKSDDFVPSMILKSQFNKKRYISIQDLYQNINYHNKAGIPYENHKVIFWKKVLLPFSCCIIVFVGLPFLFTRMRSTNQSQRLIFGVLFGITYFVLTSIITNLSLIIGIPALPSVLISMVLFITIGIYLFNSLVKKDIPI